MVWRAEESEVNAVEGGLMRGDKDLLLGAWGDLGVTLARRALRGSKDHLNLGVSGKDLEQLIAGETRRAVDADAYHCLLQVTRPVIKKHQLSVWRTGG